MGVAIISEEESIMQESSINWEPASAWYHIDYQEARDRIRQRVESDDSIPSSLKHDAYLQAFHEWHSQIIPPVGCGATASVGSDRYPYEVTRIGQGKSRARIWVRPLDYRCQKGIGEGGCEEYLFAEDSDWHEVEVRWSAKRKAWTIAGRGTPVAFNGAGAYRDPSF